MRRLALAAALLLSAVAVRPGAQPPARSSPLDPVGTWTLAAAEPGDGVPAPGRGDGAATGRGARGDGAPAAGRGGGGGGANLKGLLVFDTAGHAFEMITRAMAFHQILSGISDTGGTTLKRPLELSGSGDDVTIKFPPTTNQQGEQTTTLVMLHRLSGEKDMIPPAAAAR
ncbi:MAG: hypothetical protein ABI868_10695 [Acidobacteriota bacterium]